MSKIRKCKKEEMLVRNIISKKAVRCKNRSTKIFQNLFGEEDE